MTINDVRRTTNQGPAAMELRLSRIFFWEGQLAVSIINKSASAVHRAAYLFLFRIVARYLLLIPHYLPHVYSKPNPGWESAPRFRVVNTPFLSLGPNIHLGV
jgi:hypothetical protein